MRIPNFEKRIRAFSIDTSFAMILIMLLLGFNLKADVRGVFAFIILACVYLGPHFFSKGQTFGKRTQLIKVINFDGTEASLLKVIGRDVFKVALSIFTGGIYMIICYFMVDEKGDHRAIHDYIFKTIVVDLDKKKYYKDDYLQKSSSIRKRGL